jgi:hypothetical protein
MFGACEVMQFTLTLLVAHWEPFSEFPGASIARLMELDDDST